MSACKPYGDTATARLMVIGHDPRLHLGKAEAKYAFFLDYLERPIPLIRSERRKYEFASAVVRYVRFLAGFSIPITDQYFTNLCNEFINGPIYSGTVLIPDDFADTGIRAIEDTLNRGSFKVILAMTPQVFYHLARTGFVNNSDDRVIPFYRNARPSFAAMNKKAYVPTAKSPFLAVCGLKFHHRNDNIPVVPIVHAKQWPLNARMNPHYGSLMEMAAKNVRNCIGDTLRSNTREIPQN